MLAGLTLQAFMNQGPKNTQAACAFSGSPHLAVSTRSPTLCGFRRGLLSRAAQAVAREGAEKTWSVGRMEQPMVRSFKCTSAQSSV